MAEYEDLLDESDGGLGREDAGLTDDTDLGESFGEESGLSGLVAAADALDEARKAEDEAFKGALARMDAANQPGLAPPANEAEAAAQRLANASSAAMAEMKALLEGAAAAREAELHPPVGEPEPAPVPFDQLSPEAQTLLQAAVVRRGPAYGEKPSDWSSADAWRDYLVSRGIGS